MEGLQKGVCVCDIVPKAFKTHLTLEYKMEKLGY